MFREIVKVLVNKNPEQVKALFSSMTDKQRTFLKNNLQSKRINIKVKKGEQEQVARRVIQVRRKNKPAA